MKYGYSFLLLLLLLMPDLQAQELNFDQIVGSEDARPRSFEDYLVNLAWKNSPHNRMVEQEKVINELELKKAKRTWIKGINGGLNLNPGNQVIMIGNDPYILPGINYGLSFNPSAIIESGTEKKIASEKLQIADFAIDQEKLKVRAEVKARYEKYKMAVEILKSRDQMEVNAESALSIISKSFKNGKVPYTDYSRATADYNLAKEGRIEAESSVALAIIALEEMIGIDWEVAVRKKDMF